MVSSDKTLCDLLLQMLELPRYAHWTEQRKELRDIRDLLALSPPEGESALLLEFLSRDRPFWNAVTADLNWRVYELVTQSTARFTQTRENRPLNAEELKEGAKINDLFKTILELNKSQMRPTRR